MAQRKFNKKAEISKVEGLFNDNHEGLRELIEDLCQQIMEREINQHLCALSYERTNYRKGYRNGYKTRMLNTRVGKLNLNV